jgi:hypothetical protein
MDAMRKQLDVLMGANRNGDVEEVNRNYYDRDVCRLFLAGLCPHDLFQLTKMISDLVRRFTRFSYGKTMKKQNQRDQRILIESLRI